MLSGQNNGQDVGCGAAVVRLRWFHSSDLHSLGAAVANTLVCCIYNVVTKKKKPQKMQHACIFEVNNEQTSHTPHSLFLGSMPA